MKTLYTYVPTKTATEEPGQFKFSHEKITIPDNGDCAIIALATIYPQGEEALKKVINKNSNLTISRSEPLRYVIATYCQKILSKERNFNNGVAADIYEFLLSVATGANRAAETEPVKKLYTHLMSLLEITNIYEVDQCIKLIKAKINVIETYFQALADPQSRELQFSKNTIRQIAVHFALPLLIFGAYTQQTQNQTENPTETLAVEQEYCHTPLITDTTPLPCHALHWQETHVDVIEFSADEENQQSLKEFYTALREQSLSAPLPDDQRLEMLDQLRQLSKDFSSDAKSSALQKLQQADEKTLLMAAFSGNNDAIEERLKMGNLKQDAVFRAAHKNISDLLKPNSDDLSLICS